MLINFYFKTIIILIMKLLILLFIFKNSFENILKFSFKTENNINPNYYSIPIENREIIYLKIGTPEKKTPLIINFCQYLSFITGSKILNSTYNELSSSTYKNKSNSLKELNYEFKIRGYESEEKFYFPTYKSKEISVNNFLFYLVTESSLSDKNYGFLGLRIKPYVQIKEDNSFINLLKRHNITNNYIWTIKYENENNGNLIIGDYPHNYDKLNYNEQQLKNTKTEIITNANMWEIKFDKIYFNNSEFKVKANAIFKIEIGVILGPNELKKIFYETYVKNKTCEEYLVDMESEDNTYGFKCYVNKFQKNYFQSLIFLHKELYYNFTLTGNDLFIENNGFYYFLIIFETTHSYSWIFGKPFLKKYQFVFDPDNKKIEFYNPNVIIKKNSNYIKILIVFFLITIIFLIFFLSWLYKKRRKRRINEIDEIFDYTPASI